MREKIDTTEKSVDMYSYDAIDVQPSSQKFSFQVFFLVISKM